MYLRKLNADAGRRNRELSAWLVRAGQRQIDDAAERVARLGSPAQQSLREAAEQQLAQYKRASRQRLPDLTARLTEAHTSAQMAQIDRALSWAYAAYDELVQAAAQYGTPPSPATFAVGPEFEANMRRAERAAIEALDGIGLDAGAQLRAARSAAEADVAAAATNSTESSSGAASVSERELQTTNDLLGDILTELQAQSKANQRREFVEPRHSDSRHSDAARHRLHLAAPGRAARSSSAGAYWNGA